MQYHFVFNSLFSDLHLWGSRTGTRRTGYQALYYDRAYETLAHWGRILVVKHGWSLHYRQGYVVLTSCRTTPDRPPMRICLPQSFDLFEENTCLKYMQTDLNTLSIIDRTEQDLTSPIFDGPDEVFNIVFMLMCILPGIIILRSTHYEVIPPSTRHEEPRSITYTSDRCLPSPRWLKENEVALEKIFERRGLETLIRAADDDRYCTITTPFVDDSAILPCTDRGCGHCGVCLPFRQLPAPHSRLHLAAP